MKKSARRKAVTQDEEWVLHERRLDALLQRLLRIPAGALPPSDQEIPRARWEDGP